MMIVADLVAILTLTFGIYFPRHHRRDLVVAFLGVNIGVLAVSAILDSATIGAGLGLGLFGVLSIIRLRSAEIAQYEVAYYFASLSLGLISGIGGTLNLTTASLLALVVGALYLGDHGLLLRRYRQQTIRLDRAFLDEGQLRDHLCERLAGKVVNLVVQHVDLVNETTLVDVRYVVGRRRATRPEPSPIHERISA